MHVLQHGYAYWNASIHASFIRNPTCGLFFPLFFFFLCWLCCTLNLQLENRLKNRFLPVALIDQISVFPLYSILCQVYLHTSATTPFILFLNHIFSIMCFFHRRCRFDSIHSLSVACVPLVTCPEVGPLIGALLKHCNLCRCSHLSEEFITAVNTALLRYTFFFFF